MNNSKTMAVISIVLMAVMTITLSGCFEAQDAGSDTKVLGWDENGPYVYKRKTNGAHVAVGKQVVETGAQFNATVQRKHKLSTVEKLAEGKNPVVKTAGDVVTVTNGLMGI